MNPLSPLRISRSGIPPLLRLPALMLMLLLISLPRHAAFAQDPPASAAPPPSTLEARFREALFAEEGRLDLEKAAQTYQELLAAFDQDRAIAASALFRLAEVQRKLNQPDAARASLRRLVREFPDREPLARLARENLKALGDNAADLEPGAAPVPSVAADPAAEEENRELARLQEMAKNSPDLLHSRNSGADRTLSAMVDALQKGRARVVTFLLDKGGNVDSTPEGFVPLMVASRDGHKAVVELLLHRGAVLNAEAASEAIRMNRVIILKLLLERGLKARGAGLLEAALQKPQHDTEVIELLLDSGADANEVVACYAQSFSVPLYRGVLARKQNQQNNGSEEIKMPALLAACVRERPDIVKLLLEKGADVNAMLQGGTSALELACLSNQTEIVEMLLKAGADAKHIAPGGLRLTDIAAYHRSTEIYRLLREAGAEVQGAGPSGKTLWYFFVQSSNIYNSETAKQALEFATAAVVDGVNFNGLNDGEDPFLTAVRSGNLEAVKFFLNAGADVKRDGRTPVMVAALRAGLIEKPGERTIVNGSPVTPMAFSASAMDLFRLLLNAEADLNAANPQTERVLLTWGLDFKNVTAFHHLVASSPDMATLEAFLALDPDPHVLAGTLDAKGMEDRKCRPVELTEVFNSGILLSTELRRRLWEYTWLEHTPDRAKQVWFNSSPFTDSSFTYQGVFTAAESEGQTLNAAEALAFVFDGDKNTLLPPDFQNLTILRMDPATGKTASKETVNLQALLEKGDASALPVLKPGDILDASRETGDSKDYAANWRNFPEPLPGLFRKALTRRVTVKAGDWTRTFQVLPAREDFRWDPATDKLSADCTPASLIRFLPKPEFFYQMNTVTVNQPGKEPVTLDFTNPEANAAAKAERLTDGAEIVLPAVPADSPELKARLSQGIFISREEDGFLREIFRVKDVPENIKNYVRPDDVLAAAWDEGVWLLPFTDKIFIKTPSSDGTPQVTEGVDLISYLTGGCVVERPKDTRSEGRIWNIKEWQEQLDESHLEQQVNLVLRNRSEQRIFQYSRSAMYSLTEEGWIRQESNVPVRNYVESRAVRMRSRTLEDFLKAVLREMPGKGLVELRRPESMDYPSGEPVWIDLEKGIPFVLLNSNDAVILEPDMPVRDLSPASPQPQATPQPAPASRRRVVLPAN